MRRILMLVVAWSGAFIAIKHSDLSAMSALPADRVTITVRSVRAGESVEFAYRTVGEGLMGGEGKDSLKNTIRSQSAGPRGACVVSSIGGTGVMRIEVKSPSGATGSSAGAVVLGVVQNGRVAITGFAK